MFLLGKIKRYYKFKIESLSFAALASVLNFTSLFPDTKDGFLPFMQ